MSSSNYCIRTLASGLRVVIEEIPSAYSSAIGFLVSTGARNEPSELMGVSHFLEHMAFKSTKKRTALEINIALDNMGSHANAYTSWERTVFFAQVIPDFAEKAIDLLAEMIDPAFLKEDFDCEKNVILEEIEMYNDRPESLLFDEIMKLRYSPHPLGSRILGTIESIRNMSAEAMMNYHSSRYNPQGIVLSAAGKVNADEIISTAEKISLPSGIKSINKIGNEKPAEYRGRNVVIRKGDIAEQYAAVWKCFSLKEIRNLYIAGIAGIIIGDKEGSRLSWALTHTGLAQSAETGQIPFSDTGIFYLTFSTLPEHFTKCRDIALEEIKKLHKDAPPDEKEFERAKTKFASRTILSSESTQARMMDIGIEALIGHPHISLQEELDLIMSIKYKEAAEFINSLNEPEVEAAIGPMESPMGLDLK